MAYLQNYQSQWSESNLTGVSQGPGVAIFWEDPEHPDTGANIHLVAAILIERAERLGLDVNEVITKAQELYSTSDEDSDSDSDSGDASDDDSDDKSE